MFRYTLLMLAMLAIFAPVARAQDSDNDLLDDIDETDIYGTDPFNPDTDSDGLLDGFEVIYFGTDPLNPDTDGDGASDGDEVAQGADPLSPAVTRGMYACDDAGNFFRINLDTAVPTVISTGFASSFSDHPLADVEYDNETLVGVASEGFKNAGMGTTSFLDFHTGVAGAAIPGRGTYQALEFEAGNGVNSQPSLIGIYARPPYPACGCPDDYDDHDESDSYRFYIDGTTKVGPIQTGYRLVNGLARHPLTGNRYAVAAGLRTTPPKLLWSDRFRYGTYAMGPDLSVELGSLEFDDDGRLWGGGAGPNANELYQIDPDTGAATLVGNTGLGATSITGLAFVSAKPDSDRDGLTDEDETTLYGTDPLNRDTDGDGLYDGLEVGYIGSDPNNTDTDGEGLTDGEEWNTWGTDPTNPDTDGDGLTEYEEIWVYFTDWALPDTDGDQLLDGDEVHLYGTHPNNPDTDGDDIWDGDEIFGYGTDPLNPDTDGGGVDDGTEVLIDGTDPLNPADDIPLCPVDFNNDGFVDSGDINAFIALFLASDPTVDFNNDGFIDSGDINEFIALFLAGC